MEGEYFWVTETAYKKLQGDLHELKTVKRPEVIKGIAEARAHGDISENAEYDAAKERQSLVEAQIAQLEDRLARARVLEDEDELPSDKVLIGATVKLRDLERGEELAYTLVSAEEADYGQGKISVDSPVGKGLLGKAIGDTAEIQIPAGLVRYEVLEISR